MANIVDGDLRVGGDLVLTGTGKKIKPDISRSNLLQENLAVYPIALATFFVWDSGQPLPATPAADDLSLIPGTFGASTPILSSGDVKNATTTRYARAVVTLPPEYVAGETVAIRLSAGMLTTVASSSCTADLEAYRVGRDSLVDGSDLVLTAAQTINSLTVADKDFLIAAAGLQPGDQLDVRLALACVDSATATAVKPSVASLELLCDIKG